VTSGAASDIQQVSRIARAMVTQFGISDKLGNIDYANEQQSYLGAYNGGTNHGDETQKLIDEEVQKLVDEGYDTAKRILTEHADELENLAQGLLEYETLTGIEITRVMAGEPPRSSDDDDGTGVEPAETSVTAIPKTRPKPKTGGGGMEPEPSA